MLMLNFCYIPNITMERTTNFYEHISCHILIVCKFCHC